MHFSPDAGLGVMMRGGEGGELHGLGKGAFLFGASQVPPYKSESWSADVTATSPSSPRAIGGPFSGGSRNISTFGSRAERQSSIGSFPSKRNKSERDDIRRGLVKSKAPSDETVCHLLTGVLKAEDPDLQAHLDSLSAADLRVWVRRLAGEVNRCGAVLDFTHGMATRPQEPVDMLHTTRAAAVHLAGARDGTVYFENPYTKTYDGNTSSVEDSTGRIQVSEGKLCVPTVTAALPNGAEMATVIEVYGSVRCSEVGGLKGGGKGFTGSDQFMMSALGSAAAMAFRSSPAAMMSFGYCSSSDATNSSLPSVSRHGDVTQTLATAELRTDVSKEETTTAETRSIEEEEDGEGVKAGKEATEAATAAAANPFVDGGKVVSHKTLPMRGILSPSVAASTSASSADGSPTLPPLSSPKRAVTAGARIGVRRGSSGWVVGSGVPPLERGVVSTTDAFIPGQFRRLSVMPTASLSPQSGNLPSSPSGSEAAYSPSHSRRHGVSVPRGGGMGPVTPKLSGNGSKYRNGGGTEIGQMDHEQRRRASVLATVLP